MRILTASLILLLLTGCGRELTPLERAAGSWPGELRIETANGSQAPAELQKWMMKGNLWLFITDSKFRLEMSTANQEFTVKGKWNAKGNRVTMRAEDYEFTFPPEEDRQARNLPVVSADEIRKTFHNPLVFDVSADRRTLTGLKISLGPLIGTFRFERAIPR